MITLGSQAATLADIQAPTGNIRHIIAVASSNSAGTGVGVGLLRVEGDLLKGPESYAIGGSGGNSATAIPVNNIPILLNDVNIPCTNGGRIAVFGEMTPTDVGQITIGVTLIFE
jgi:hypothetical protein